MQYLPVFHHYIWVCSHRRTFALWLFCRHKCSFAVCRLYPSTAYVLRVDLYVVEYLPCVDIKLRHNYWLPAA